MSKLIAKDPLYIAVRIPEEPTCRSCVFNEEVAGCMEHACTSDAFPEGHPLRKPREGHEIIWIKRKPASSRDQWAFKDTGPLEVGDAA